MTPPRRQVRLFGQSRVGVAVLGLVALGTMIASSMLFLRLLDSERAMDALVREDAMWAVFQSDRHLRAFEHSVSLILETGDPAHHPQMLHHYDILYSRVRLLERGTFVLDLNTNGPLSALGNDLRGAIVPMAAAIDALDPASPGYLDAVAAMGADLPRLHEVSNDLVLAANAEINAARVRERDQRRRLQDQLAVLAMVGILAFIGIFGLLMLQLRRIGRSNQLMALLQERSRRRAMRAQAASRAKSAFLATMSHEIRTPLNGIIGSAELLALGPTAPEQQPRLDTIRASAFLLRDLIDGILDYSKLDAGVIEARQAEVDLAELADVLGQAFAAQAARAGLTLDIRLPAARILTNDLRLRQVLVNLIGNALKFTPSGGIRVRGRLEDGPLLRVSVEDDGIGIAPADQARLFAEFIQVDGSFARPYGGTGLGLAICKRILDGLGGSIGVESALGQGSRFWFTLPVQPAPEAPPEAEPPAAPPRALTLLVVEDNEVNLTVVSGLLEHLGHRCSAARNGHEALERLSHEQPDLIFMDMQMPLMDGIEATRAIRRAGLTLPIVGVTANALPEDRAACLAAGMDDFLPKPLTLDSVAQMLTRMTARLPPPDDPAPGDPPIRSEEPLRARDGPGPDVGGQGAAPPGADPALPAENPQLADLIAVLGADTAGSLIARFETELDQTDQALQSALATPDPDEIDSLLHTFKGAALTLGLTRSGLLAQDLRRQTPFVSADRERLIALARTEIEQTRHHFLKVEAP